LIFSSRVNKRHESNSAFIEKETIMKSLLGILALSSLSLGAMAGDLGSKKTIKLNAKGKISCETVESSTGYLPHMVDVVRLTLSDTEVNKLTLLAHSSAESRSGLGACSRIAALDASNLTVQVVVNAGTNGPAEDQRLYESLTLTIPNVATLYSSESGRLVQE